MANGRGAGPGARRAIPHLVALLVLGAYVAVTAWLFLSVTPPNALLVALSVWFDPVFFQYNLLLLTFAVLIIPAITVLYVVRMKTEKLRRMQSELPPEEYLGQRGEYLRQRLEETFQVRKYLGSMSTMTVVVLFGVGIILLFKPAPSGATGGVDFGLGANFLMLGPFMAEYVRGDQAYVERLMISLTAFQFGFAGGYVYFLTHLVRSYFTLDLTPNTFVSASVRMILGSVLALVISFVGLPGVDWPGGVVALSFFIGFFPSRGLLFLEKLVTDRIPGLRRESRETPLRSLRGMSEAHEVRLDREGLDNVENLAQANWLDLYFRTALPIAQLRSWIGEAWLRTHLGDDYEVVRAATGITDASELQTILEGGPPEWGRLFGPEDGERLGRKMELVGRLLPEWLERHRV